MAAQLRAIPRILVAATGSGSGKTTVAVGLAAALRARGLRVAPFKCGPDYLDPTYHARAAKRPSHNLDGWMMGRGAVLTTFARAAADADIAIIEGMMGLFDGATPSSDEGSSAEIAKWLEAPVLLVVDASGMARTIAAIAAGFAEYDPALRPAGLICNRVGGRGHLDLLRAASPEIPIVGGLPRNDEAAFPERHLGLLSADERSVPSTHIDNWAAIAAEWLDLDAITAIAQSAPPIPASVAITRLRADPGTLCTIGIAWDEAFHFYYDYNLALLEALGARLVRFSPVHDRALPDVDGLHFGGGYPEVAAPELSANLAMISGVHEFAHSGRPIYAECGGLMYLMERIRVAGGETFGMVGLMPGEATMHQRLQALGYVEVETTADSILGPAGLKFRGHQFRYSTLEPAPPAKVSRVYRVRQRWGGEEFAEGFVIGNVLASYVHAHWASNPAPARNLVAACVAGRGRK